MHEVKPIGVLEGQRSSLLAPEDRRKALYREQVMESLRPI